MSATDANTYPVSIRTGMLIPRLIKTVASAHDTADSAIEKDFPRMIKTRNAVYLQLQQALRQQFMSILHAQQVAHCSQKPPPICCCSSYPGCGPLCA